MAEAEASLFTVGESFKTYEAFERAINAYERTDYLQFWKHDARLVAAVKKRLNRPLKAELKCYELKLCCIHGGQPFKPKGKGIRSTWTFKQDCQAHISLKVNEAGEALRINSLNLEHNHDVSKVLFHHLLKQRKLSTEEKDRATSLLQIRPNKKMLQQQLWQETGKVVLLKDLTNLLLEMKRGNSKNDLDAILLPSSWRSMVLLLTYILMRKRISKASFFLDNEMKQVFQAYPKYCSLMQRISCLN